MKEVQALQETQYEFPYHYLPHWPGDGAAVRLRGLSWGLEYLCYLRHAKELIESFAPSSVLDVGCGDGRLIGILDKRIDVRVGVDISERAIGFAKAFSPDATFAAVDAGDLDRSFDVVSAIEVLEHIPESDVSRFINVLAERTTRDGHVIISVPTVKLPANPKHHRHYTGDLLRQQISDSKAPVEILGMTDVYRRSILVEWYLRLTYNKYWKIEVEPCCRLIWGIIWKRLRRAPAGSGNHLFAVLRRL